MELAEIIKLVISILTLGSIIFSIFFFFRNPQEKLEKNQIINEERDKNKATVLEAKEVENKAAVLEKQFQWYMEVNNQKFCDMGKRLDDSFLLASNHTNTVDTKVDKLIQSTNLMSNEITRLGTIIEERIPKKV